MTRAPGPVSVVRLSGIRQGDSSSPVPHGRIPGPRPLQPRPEHAGTGTGHGRAVKEPEARTEADEAHRRHRETQPGPFIRCTGTTMAGESCRSYARSGTDLCRIHLEKVLGMKRPEGVPPTDETSGE